VPPLVGNVFDTHLVDSLPVQRQVLAGLVCSSIRFFGDPPATSADAMRRKRRLTIICYLAREEFSPRGIRARELMRALQDEWAVDLIAGPERESQSDTLWPKRPWLQRRAASVASAFLLDKYEFSSRRELRRWVPQTDAALLIGFPFSPLAQGSRRLVHHRLRYVVDIGDPWALTALHPAVRGPALHRARRAERNMWMHASGAIVTTDAQAEALKDLFPRLPIVVRPNGCFANLATSSFDGAPRRGTNRVLRLAHFGEIYAARVDVVPFLGRLAQSGMWNGIEVHQFGPDRAAALAELPPLVRSISHAPRPWSDIIRTAREFDAAIAIGNLDPAQLPSKVIDYLVLSVPRIAITANPRLDAIARYVADKVGWLVVSPDDPEGPGRVLAHVQRSWSVEELRPPESESWQCVGQLISRFLDDVLTAPGRHLAH
jgi:hypothetical protein